jgi:hypothetical protein
LAKEGGIFTNKSLLLGRFVDKRPVLCVFLKDGRHLIPPPFSTHSSLSIGGFSSNPEPALATSVAKTGNFFSPLPSGGRGIPLRD